MTVTLALGTAGGAAAATAGDRTAALVSDQTTAGRRLLHGALPRYPAEEQGRWTQGCVSFHYAVRADGQADRFVLLEVAGGGHRYFWPNRADREAMGQLFLRFANLSLQALHDWRFAPATAATEEITVFRFERTEMGGHLMKISARRLDLGTPDPVGCHALDPIHVRRVVAESHVRRKS